jgi:hypothetical protein
MADPTATSTPSDPRLGAALAESLRPLLRTQATRLRARYLWHGLALAALLPAAAILLFFALDHALRLPLPIRLLHTATTVGLLGYVVWRYVRYPLTRTFADVDTAVLLERCFPELHQRLVSAVQLRELGDDQLRNQSRAMIDRLLAETEAAARALPLARMFDHRTTLRVSAGAAVLLGLLGLGASLGPATARAFVLRHLGVAADYPRETTLVVEVPPAGPEVQRTDRDGSIELVLPAGADLHVSVLAMGVVPKDVFLDVLPLRSQSPGPDARTAEAGDQRSVTMAARPGGRFRHVFRRLTGSFEFHARGGDDDHGDRRVVVRTVHPPQVAAIRGAVTPPAYTGLGVLEQNSGAIEALVGSGVEITVTTTAPVQAAAMVFLESGKRLPLQVADAVDDGGTGTTHRGRFVVEGSDRYQIELQADSGLRNPNPGTYPIAALQDYAPVGRWLLPDDESTLLLPTGVLCVRIDVHDDFGLLAVDLGVDHAGGRSLQRSLLPAGRAPTKAALVTELFEVADLLAAAKSQHEGLSLQLLLRDNRQPEAGATELPRRIVQVVEPQQLAEAIGKMFRALREEATQALDVQTDRRNRLDELRREGPGAGNDLTQVLTGIEVGQSRVVDSCERLHRGLMRAFDVHLWNRLEQSQHQKQVLDLYRAFSSTLQEPVALAPAFYRDLTQRRAAGTLGAMETVLDPILAMVSIADQLATVDGPRASRQLAEAQVARPGSDFAARLEQALATQDRIQQALQQLLLRLEEWNDYQDLIQEARALRDRQRDLQGRTEEARGNK